MAAGAMLYGIAILGALIVVGLQVLLRPVGMAIDRQVARGQSIGRYNVTVLVETGAIGPVQDLLGQGLEQTDGMSRLSHDVRVTHDEGGQMSWTLAGRPSDARQFENVLPEVMSLPGVLSVNWTEYPAEEPAMRKSQTS